MDKNPHILTAIMLLGGQTESARIGQAEAARILNVKYQSIQSWRRQGAVPSKYCAKIEQALQGKITVKQLRPNDWEQFWPSGSAIVQPPAPSTTGLDHA